MESTSRTNGYQPLDIINVLLLILCLFVFSTPAFAEQAVSRVQFLADSAFYLSSKSDTSIQHLVPHIALPQRDKPGTDFDGNKVRANSKPSMDADHPLIAFQTEYPHARIKYLDKITSLFFNYLLLVILRSAAKPVPSLRSRTSSKLAAGKNLMP